MRKMKLKLKNQQEYFLYMEDWEKQKKFNEERLIPPGPGILVLSGVVPRSKWAEES
jgi:hypothetical protein